MAQHAFKHVMDLFHDTFLLSGVVRNITRPSDHCGLPRKSNLGGLLALIVSFSCVAGVANAEIPLEGFLPFVGLGLTDEFEDSATGNPFFFLAEQSNSVGGQPLGTGGTAFYDVALFDTGAATHILTYEASTTGFDIAGNEFDGTNIQPIGGATGIINLNINDPLGLYVAGLGDRISGGSTLAMNPAALRGQTSVATLSAPDASFKLPNIVGLPIAAQHGIHIQNSDPQIFELGGRTVRTPQIDLTTLGSGGQDIVRRLQLNLNPGPSFASGPLYVFDFNGIGQGDPLHENPASPTIVENGALFIDVDMELGAESVSNSPFLFDTGASLTVLSTNTAVLLGIDPILDAPEFTLVVEGSGGISSGIPGYFIDELSLNTAGGTFVRQNVPIAVLDVTNPSDPGNVVPGILGMNVFADRDLVIDANPSLGGIGAPPALYISDSVTADFAWTSASATETFSTANHWSTNLTPDIMSDVTIANVSGSNQQAVLSSDSTVYRATISGDIGAEMAVVVQGGRTLTAYADIVVKKGGRIHLQPVGDPSIAKVDAQFIAIEDGSLTGTGEIFVGSGPIEGSIRNVDGLIAPGDPNGSGFGQIGRIEMVGDLSNQATLAFEIGGMASGEFDSLSISRNVYLNGTLDVSLVDLGGGIFTPQPGDTFDLITVGDSVVGTFDDVVLPENSGSLAWMVSYTENSVQVKYGFACDADGDGDCQLNDLDAFYNAFGTAGGQFDFDGSGTVDANDIAGWLVAASDPLNPAKSSSTDTYVLGDVDLSGDVNSVDLGLLLNFFGDTSNQGWGRGNLNGDADVDSVDLGRLLNNFNFSSAAAAAVPEPNTGMLVVLGLALLACRSTARFGYGWRSIHQTWRDPRTEVSS